MEKIEITRKEFEEMYIITDVKQKKDSREAAYSDDDNKVIEEADEKLEEEVENDW